MGKKRQENDVASVSVENSYPDDDTPLVVQDEKPRKKKVMKERYYALEGTNRLSGKKEEFWRGATIGKCRKYYRSNGPVFDQLYSDARVLRVYPLTLAEAGLSGD